MLHLSTNTYRAPMYVELPILNSYITMPSDHAEYDGSTNHWDEPSAGTTTQHMANVIVNTGNGYNYSLLLHSGDISYATGYEVRSTKREAAVSVKSTQ